MKHRARIMSGVAARMVLVVCCCCAAARAQEVVAPKNPVPVPIVPSLPAPGPPVALSLKTPVAGPETYLALFAPRSVNFNTGVVEFNAVEYWQDGSVWLFFKPDVAGKYLIDCEVKKSGSGVFSITIPESGKSLTPVPAQSTYPFGEAFTVELPNAERRAFILQFSSRWTFRQCVIGRT